MSQRQALPDPDGETFKRMVGEQAVSGDDLAEKAGIQTGWMDDWRYQMSKKQASQIIEHGRAA